MSFCAACQDFLECLRKKTWSFNLSGIQEEDRSITTGMKKKKNKEIRGGGGVLRLSGGERLLSEAYSLWKSARSLDLGIFLPWESLRRWQSSSSVSFFREFDEEERHPAASNFSNGFPPAHKEIQKTWEESRKGKQRREEEEGGIPCRMTEGRELYFSSTKRERREDRGGEERARTRRNSRSKRRRGRKRRKERRDQRRETPNHVYNAERSI